MANDNPCEVVGEGEVRIKMFDGVVRTIHHVRHVSGLKKKLLSLGVFDEQGYRFNDENSCLKVTKRVLVMLKREKVDNLYRLVG